MLADRLLRSYALPRCYVPGAGLLRFRRELAHREAMVVQGLENALLLSLLSVPRPAPAKP